MLDHDKCYHIGNYDYYMGGYGSGETVEWVEPQNFMETIKRLLTDGSDRKYIVSCPIWADGFGDTVVWARGDTVHMAEEYYSEYQWSVGLAQLTIKSFDSPRYRIEDGAEVGCGIGGVVGE